MTYTLRTKNEPVTQYPDQFTTVGKAFEKAVDLMQYMQEGAEILIINDLGIPAYCVQFISYKEFRITAMD